MILEVKIVGSGPNFGTFRSKLVEKIILEVKIGGKNYLGGQNCRVRPQFWYRRVKIGGKIDFYSQFLSQLIQLQIIMESNQIDMNTCCRARTCCSVNIPMHS